MRLIYRMGRFYLRATLSHILFSLFISQVHHQQILVHILQIWSGRCRTVVLLETPAWRSHVVHAHVRLDVLLLSSDICVDCPVQIPHRKGQSASESVCQQIFDILLKKFECLAIKFIFIPIYFTILHPRWAHFINQM